MATASRLLSARSGRRLKRRRLSSSNSPASLLDVMCDSCQSFDLRLSDFTSQKLDSEANSSLEDRQEHDQEMNLVAGEEDEFEDVSEDREIDDEPGEEDASVDVRVDVRGHDLTDDGIDVDRENLPIRFTTLGSILEIMVRVHCPLCRLVVKAFHNDTPSYVRSQHVQNDKVTCTIFLLQIGPIIDYSTQERRHPVVLEVEFTETGGPTWSTYFVPMRDCAHAAGVKGSQYFGRTYLTKQQRFDIVRQWLGTCASEHRGSCSGTHLPAISHKNFLLIDVEDQCLVEAPVGCHYAALSYVWGTRPFFQLNKQNLSALKTIRGLAAFISQLPQTIRDAMEVVRLISERYLWVDSLCIVQDDASQKHDLISSMDHIYGGAFFTIFAVTGDEADSGLFTKITRESPSQERILEDLTLLGIRSYDAVYNNFSGSHGNWFHERRGWTFQEQILSCRRVLFIDGLAFFVCPNATWREDVIGEESENIGLWDHLFQLPGHDLRIPADMKPVEAFNQYSSCVSAYTARALSYPSDILNAFSGLAKILAASMKTTMLFGLPAAVFDVAFLWSTMERHGKRLDWPSWSWSGWLGQIGTWDKCIHQGGSELELLNRHTWIEWHYYDETKSEFVPLRHLIGGSSGPASSMSEHYHAYLGGLPNGNTKLYLDSRDPCAQFASLCANSPLPTAVSKSASTSPNSGGLLRFYTVSTHFDLEIASRQDGGLCEVVIRDQSGMIAGALDTSFLEEEITDLCLVGRREVILLSEKMGRKWHAPDHWVSQMDFVEDYQRQGYPDGPDANVAFLEWMVSTPQNKTWDAPEDASNWKLYNILVIERKGDVAYRIGLGWIYQDSWNKGFAPGSQWKEMTLA